MDKSIAQRVEWLDRMRGVGIILVVMAHCSAPHLYLRYVTYILPVFLFVSGVVYRHLSFAAQVRRAARRTLVPYLFMGAVSLSVYLLLKVLLNPPQFQTSASEEILNFLLLRSPPNEPPLVVIPLWYLLLFFWCELMYRALAGVRMTWLSVPLALLAMNYPQPWLWWKIDLAFYALPFFAFGVQWQKVRAASSPMRPLLCLLLGCVLIAAAGYYNNEIDVRLHRFGASPLWTLAGGLGWILFAAGWAASTTALFIPRLLELFGKNTLLVLGYHPLLTMLLLASVFSTAPQTPNTLTLWSAFCIALIVSLALLLKFIPESLRFLLAGKSLR